MLHTSTLPANPLAPALNDHIRSLGRHLAQCRLDQGRFFRLSCLVTDMHGWVAPRFVTTLAVAAVVIALLS